MFGLEKIFSHGAALGVDIGTTSIKIVELKKKGNLTNLHNYGMLESYGHFERGNDVIQANSVKLSEKQTIQLLKTLLDKVHFSTKSVIASIPAFASFISLIEMPEMSQSETQRAMSFQIKQSVPLPLSEIVVDWMKVGQKEDENGFVKQQILVVAIPNETVARYKEVFKGAGLRLRALEVENLAFARATVGADPTPTMIIDIGARATNISVIDQGFLKHNTQIDYAGDTLTRAIVKGLGISYKRAEDLKKQRGIMGGAGEYELSTLQAPFLDVILQEAKKVQQLVTTSLMVSVQRALLIGGGANLLGLDEYVQNQLQIPTVLGNGLLYVQTPQSLSVITKELQTRFATAIGLAIKNFI